MPSFLSGLLIKSIRTRRQLQQSMLIQETYDSVNLSRIENLRQSPKDDTFRELMNSLEMPVDTFFCPFLYDQTLDVFEKRDRILYLLGSTASEAWGDAEILVRELEYSGNFGTGINRQFILSCKAKLNELKLLNPADTLAFVRKGMAVTYDNFDEQNFSGGMLIFEESSLLHAMACAKYRMGNTLEAVSLLCCIQEGITCLPEDAHEKETKLTPILLTLADFLIEGEGYAEALDVCELGNTSSMMRNKGMYTPDFLFNKALCCCKLGDINLCQELLLQSYFCHSMLRRTDKAEQVREYTLNLFDTGFDTYGTEGLVCEPHDSVIEHGESIECTGIGNFIAVLREKAGLSQGELCDGICNQSTLYRIEKDWMRANVFCLEAIIQRLGRDINKYFSTFPSVEDFKAKQIRNEINACIINLNFESASRLLDELKLGKVHGKNPLIQQFVKETEAILFAGREGYDKSRYLDMLMEALSITLPRFDEDIVERYRLTYTEITLINQIAIHYSETENRKRGLKLFGRLRESINRFYVDEHEKVRTYITVLYNYSKYLGLSGYYKEALEISNEGAALAAKHKFLLQLFGLTVNQACSLLELGKEKESVPFFAMYYYCCKAFGEEDICRVVVEHVKKRLGIDFGYFGRGG